MDNEFASLPESGTLRILTTNGEETLLSFGATDTVRVLKKRLQELFAIQSQQLAAPCSAMRLISGNDVLLDHCVLGDRGVVDGDQLTLVLSHAPLGTFEYNMESFDPDIWAAVTASFTQDGEFCIYIEEEEMLSIEEDEAYDPFLDGNLWEHSYRGPVEVAGSQIQMSVQNSHRLGSFDGILEVGLLLGEILSFTSALRVFGPEGGDLVRMVSPATQTGEKMGHPERIHPTLRPYKTI